MFSLASLTQSVSQFFSVNPSVAMAQVAMMILALVLVFLVFFVTRDIMLRSHSFLYQLFSIILVAGLPGIGFLLYLLIRPARTNHERRMEHLMHDVLHKLERMQAGFGQKKAQQDEKGQKHEHKKEQK